MTPESQTWLVWVQFSRVYGLELGNGCKSWEYKLPAPPLPLPKAPQTMQRLLLGHLEISWLKYIKSAFGESKNLCFSW